MSDQRGSHAFLGFIMFCDCSPNNVIFCNEAGSVKKSLLAIALPRWEVVCEESLTWKALSFVRISKGKTE